MWPILSTVTVPFRMVCRLCSLTLHSWIGCVHLLGGGKDQFVHSVVWCWDWSVYDQRQELSSEFLVVCSQLRRSSLFVTVSRGFDCNASGRSDCNQCGCVRQGSRVLQKAWVWSLAGIDDDSRIVEMSMEEKLESGVLEASSLERVQGSIGSREVGGDIDDVVVASPHGLLAVSSLSEEVVRLSV